MTFVYAEIIDDLLWVHSDTKIKLDDHYPNTYSPEQSQLIRKYGIVKTTLICPELSISFAGNNIFLASELFRKLCEKRRFETSDVIKMAMDIHMSSKPDDIEFIIASCEDGKLSLHCIKNRELDSGCLIAWIGSPSAHNEFQKIRNERNEGRASDRTHSAFLNVVNGCSDDTVGGFAISVGYDKSQNCMKYSEVATFQSSKPQTVQPGEIVQFHLSASDGGFTIRQIPISCDELLIAIDQIEPCILYTRSRRCNKEDLENERLFFLMLPMLIRQNENCEWVKC